MFVGDQVRLKRAVTATRVGRAAGLSERHSTRTPIRTRTDHWVVSESLATASWAARARDEQLAVQLGRERGGGATSSVGYLKGLGDPARLPLATERRLVQAAKDGPPRA